MVAPLLFMPEVIRHAVLPGCPGAYALGHNRGGFTAEYVGRSDRCLQTRLRTHNRLWEFEYFIFKYAAHAQAAYQLECEYWHAIRDGLRNVIHPAAPEFSGLRCQYCGFAQSIAKLLFPPD